MSVYLQMTDEDPLSVGVIVTWAVYICHQSVCISVSIYSHPVCCWSGHWSSTLLVSNPSNRPSHGTSIIMGLACNPVTSPLRQTERATSTHSETLSHYYKPQRDIMWTRCILMRQLRSARAPFIILLSLAGGQLLWMNERECRISWNIMLIKT